MILLECKVTSAFNCVARAAFCNNSPYAAFLFLSAAQAETGVVMLIYLDQALNEQLARCAAVERTLTREDLHPAIIAGAVERVRPR